MTNEQLATLLAAYHMIVFNVCGVLEAGRAAEAKELAEHLEALLRREVSRLRNEQTIGP